MKPPTFIIQRELQKLGYQAIVGVDEAGCGALAGPVVAGAVILPLNSCLGLIRDSKLLSSNQRERLFDLIIERSTKWATGFASVKEITYLGLRPATYLAMRRAIEQIPNIDFVLVDAWTLPNLPHLQRGILKGDRLVKSIAAASIIAKVTRDRHMKRLSLDYPNYQFEVHKGYGTAFHRQAIKEHGPCRHHRLTYKIFR